MADSETDNIVVGDTAPKVTSPKSRLGDRPSRTRTRAQQNRDANREPKPKVDADDDAPVKKPLTPKERQLSEQVAFLYTGAGMAASFAGDAATGAIIRRHATPAADAWVELARTDPRVKKILERVTTGGMWTNVAMVHGSIVLAVLVEKGLIGGGGLDPTDFVPTPDPKPWQDPTYTEPTINVIPDP